MNRLVPQNIALLLVAVFGAALAVVPAQVALAQAEAEIGPVIQERVEVLVAELDERLDTPLGLMPLQELYELAGWYPRWMISQELELIVDNDEADPLVRAMGVYLLARALLHSSDVAGSQALLTAEGFLAEWSMIGPFSNDGMTGFSEVFEPELVRDPDGVYSGKVGQVRWRDVSEYARLGYTDFAVLGAPAHDAVVYAATIIDVSRRQDARLWVSTDGAYKLWLNGELVGLVNVDFGSGPIREWYEVELQRGANELVIKVAGESGALGMIVRVTDEDGNPLDDMTSSAELPYSDGALSQEQTGRVAAGILEVFEDLLLATTDDGEGEATHDELSGAALVIYRLQGEDPSEPWRQFLSHAASCSEGTSRALRLCARIQDQYWQRLQSLRWANDLSATDDAESLWVDYRLAELLYEGVGESVLDEVRLLVDQMLSANPDFIPARLLLARLYQIEGQHWQAHRILTEAMELAPHSPVVLDEYQSSLRQVGESVEAVDALRRLAEIDDGNSAESLVQTVLLSGAHEEAQALLENAIQIRPTSLALRRFLADLLLSGGEQEEAERALQRVVEMSPGSAAAWEDLGRFYVRTDREDSASEAFLQSLVIEPQNQWLSNYLAALQLEEERFYQQYVLSLDEILALRLDDAEIETRRGYYPIVSQSVVQVHPNGLTARYIQEAFQVQSRQGVGDLREYVIQFTPDIETVDILSVRIVKPDGQVLESFWRWEESLSQPWYGLYYDYRALILGFEDLAPGDILEVSYTIANLSSENMFDDYFGDFVFVQDSEPQSFVRYGLIHPAEMSLQVRAPELPHTRTSEQIGDDVHLVFELFDVPRYDEELSMPGASETAEHIHLSTFSDWGEVSAWYSNLVQDQLIASPEIESAVAELTHGLTTVEEQVAAIHEYVVRNTRYVGLEFGIHGFRPYRTTVCFARRFGDCKDTASLMKVMLQIAGIESHLVLVRTRERGNLEIAPASLAVFNHVITYIPQLDLFLDGTAGFSGVAELPSGDQGASAVIVMDDDQYRFLTIPMSEPEDNLHHVQLSVDLTTEGQTASGTILATGQHAPILRQRFEAESDRLEDFQVQLRDQWPGAEVTDLTMFGLDDITRPVEVELTFDGVSWWRESGEQMLLRPLGFESRLTQRFAPMATRRQPLVLPFPFIEHYEIVYELPDGYSVATTATEWSGQSAFGEFQLSINTVGNELFVTGNFELSTAQVSPGDYPRFREFVQSVEQTINRNISIIRQQNDSF